MKNVIERTSGVHKRSLRVKMAKSEEMMMIPKRKFERIIKLAREYSENLDRSIERVERAREEMEERRRERRRSY